MSQNETFQAKVIAALSTPGGAEAVRVFEELDAAVKLLEGDAKTAAARVAGLVGQFKAGAMDIGQFRKEMEGMGEFLKALNTSQKTQKLFTAQDVQEILNAAKAIKQASDAFTTLQKTQGIQKGNFGLDSRSIKETNDNLKVLQTNLNATMLAVQKQPGNTGLYLQKVQIESNIEALKRHKDALTNTKVAFDNFAKGFPAAQRETTKMGFGNFVESAKGLNKVWKDISDNIETNHNKKIRQGLSNYERNVRAFQKLWQDISKNIESDHNAKVKQGLSNYERNVRAFSKLWTDVAANIETKHNREIKAGLTNYIQTVRGLSSVWQTVYRNIAAEQKKVSDLETKRLDARFQVKELRDKFYQTQPGGQAAFGKFNVEQAQQGLFGNAGYVPSKVTGVGRADDIRYLKDAYAAANIAFKSAAAQSTDSEKVKKILAEIVRYESQIVSARRENKQSLENEARILQNISRLRKEESLQRQKDRSEDPQRNQADIGRQSQNMLDRITGESGGALMAVQASLMANYSILGAITGSIKLAITYSLDLQAAFKNIQAVTNTTSIEMKGLEQAIKNVAGSTKFNAREVADAALVLGQAGLSAKQVAESIGPVVMLATASGASLEQAVDIVTSVVGVFNVTTSETADVANKITQAVNVSKLSIEKLALGFQYAGNTAAQLGVSFEETTAAMAAMSNAGIKSGSTMGTGLRQLLIELQNPTEEFISSLTNVGLTMVDMDLKTQSLSEVLRKLRDAGFVASDAIKSFDVRGAAAFNALIANPEMMDETIKGLNESKAAIAANDIQMESLKNQTLRLGSTFGNLVSTALNPTAEALSHVVGGLASVIQAASQATGVIEILGTVIAGALGAAAAAMIGTAVGGLVAIAPRLVAMGAAAPAMAAVGKAILGISAAATTATSSLGALSLILSPVGLGAALAAVTAAYFIYDGVIESNSEKTDKLSAALNVAKGALDEKRQAAESLTEKVEELESKSEFLRKNEQALAVETTNLVSKFGQFGFSLDDAAGNVDNIVGKLRKLRDELRGLQAMEMQNVAGSAMQLAAEKQRQATEAADQYTRGFVTRGSSGAAALTGSRSEEFAKLLASEGGKNSSTFKLIESFNKQIAAGKSPQEIPELAAVAASMNRLTLALETQVAQGKLTGKEPVAEVLRFASAETGKVSAAVSSARIAKAEAEGAQLATDQEMQYQAFMGKSGIENKVKVTPNIAQAAKNQLGEAASPSELYNRGVILYTEATRQLKKVGESLDAEIKKDKVDPAVAAKAKMMVTNKQAELRRELEQLRKGADPYLTLNDKDAERAYQAEARLLTTRQKGGKDVQGERIALERKRGEQMIAQRLRDVQDKEGPEAQNIRREIGQQVEFKIQDIQEQATQAGGNAANKSLELLARSLEAQAANKMKEAKLSKSAVKPQDGFEDLNKAMDAGLKNISEAKALEMKAVAAKIRAGQGTPSDLAAVKEKYELASEDFSNSFRDLYAAAAKRMYDLKEVVKQAQNKLAQMKLDADAAAFDRAAPSRELALKAAMEGKTGLKGEFRQAELASAQGSLGDTRAQFTQVTTLLAEVTRQLSDLKTDRLQKQDQFKKYENMSPSDVSGMSESEKQKMFYLESSIREQTEVINKLESLGIQYQKEKRDLTAEEYALKLKIAETTDRGAKPVDITTYRSSLQKAIADYKEDLKQMNPEEMISQGFYSMLGNLQSGFSTFFTDIATGSKSASDAFRGFALSIVKAMLDIVAQQAAIALIKQLFGLFGGGGGAGEGVNASAGTADMSNVARHGGSVGRYGKVQTFAAGGSVKGGTPGRDSVPIVAMPGEFVLRTSAVSALGTDFLHQLNNAGNSMVSSSAPATGSATQGNTGSGVLNIWVVTPDQQPTPSARDIVTVVTDDISRGGSIKQMVKQVQLGNV